GRQRTAMTPVRQTRAPGNSCATLRGQVDEIRSEFDMLAFANRSRMNTHGPAQDRALLGSMNAAFLFILGFIGCQGVLDREDGTSEDALRKRRRDAAVVRRDASESMGRE